MRDSHRAQSLLLYIHAGTAQLHKRRAQWLWPSSSCQMNSSICDTIQCHLLELVTHGRLSNPWTVPTLRSIRWKTISSGNQVALDTFIADAISLIFWSVDRQSVGNIHFQRPQWVSVKMEVALSSATDYGERYEEKELLGEGGFGKVIFRKKKAENLICSHTNHQGVSSWVSKEREIICSKAVGHNKEEAERQRFGRDQPYQRPRQPLHHKVFHFSDLGFLLNLQSCQIHRGFWDGQGHCASDGASPGRGTLWEVCWWGGHSHRGQYHCHRRSNKWKKKLILSSELIWMFFFSPSFSNILLPGGLLPFCQTGLKSPVIWIILFTVLVSLVSVSFHSSVFHFWYFSHSSKGQQRFGISSQQVHRPPWSKGNETRPSKLCETHIFRQ